MVSTYAVEGETFRHDQARLWSEGRFIRVPAYSGNFDLHPDGNRFAVLRLAGGAVERDKVTFVFNFFEELERLVPTDN